MFMYFCNISLFGCWLNIYLFNNQYFYNGKIFWGIFVLKCSKTVDSSFTFPPPHTLQPSLIFRLLFYQFPKLEVKNSIAKNICLISKSQRYSPSGNVKLQRKGKYVFFFTKRWNFY